MNIITGHFTSIVILAAVAVLGFVCNKSGEVAALPFEWTNIVHQGSAFRSTTSTGTLIHFDNGGWFGHYDDHLTLGLGTADYEASVFYDSNRVVTKIIQQTTVGTNHYWLIDRNGDGLPDERRTFGEKTRDLLIRGEWSPSRGAASAPEVLVEGDWSRAHFTNGAWRVESSRKDSPPSTTERSNIGAQQNELP